MEGQQIPDDLSGAFTRAGMLARSLESAYDRLAELPHKVRELERSDAQVKEELGAIKKSMQAQWELMALVKNELQQLNQNKDEQYDKLTEGQLMIQKSIVELADTIKIHNGYIKGFPGMEESGLLSQSKVVAELVEFKHRMEIEQAKLHSLWGRYKDLIMVTGVLVAVLKAFGVL